ncbi:hypothetical protein PANT111_430013 [Pantoea brenneri]|uniref:Uncharacterized protein n=1 Tax=Pantoea brenneri TaxID=472694 RepID=A0AAX3JBC7_9GAMM|nr:hypothetical protein PANT111_430013 [Pantoea brenneri]
MSDGRDYIWWLYGYFPFLTANGPERRKTLKVMLLGHYSDEAPNKEKKR